MSQSRHAELLGPVDSAFWYLDTRLTPMNIGSIMILEGTIDYEDIVDLLESRIHTMPLYQQKVVQAQNNLGEPMWVFDEDFYVEKHVFRRTLKAPATEADFQDLLAKIIGRKLDRTKPLWELHVISGLEGNQTALLFKVHHCMVDGISAVELFTALLDISPEAPVIEPPQIYDPPPAPAQKELPRQALQKSIPHRLKLAQRIGTDMLNIGMNLFERKQRRQTLNGMVGLISDSLTRINPLAINGENAGQVAIRWSEFVIDEVLEIRETQRCSVNEVMLAILGTAIGRYQSQVGEEIDQDFVRVIIPVNMRNERINQPIDGNRISMLPIEIPLFAADVVDCLEEVARYSRTMKSSELAKSFDIALTLPSFAISPIQPLIWDIVPKVFAAFAHTWATNVAGPPTPMYLLGRELKHVFGFLPINASMGLANTILSYDGKISITMLMDTGIVQVPDLLNQLVQEAYLELREASGVEPMQHDIVHEVKSPEPMRDEEPLFNDRNLRQALTTENVVAEAESVVKTETALRLLSEEWAQALQVALNDSKDYYRASTGWTKGAVALVMEAAPEKGYPTGEAVLLDLYRGKCREAHNMPVAEAKRQARFVLESNYDNWMSVLEGKSPVIPMIVRGKIRLTRGALLQLMPFTKSSQELVNCAIQITQE